MKVEKTVIVGPPAINRALVHRAPAAATSARAKAQTSSFANFSTRRRPFKIKSKYLKANQAI
jgi:hypothetical protein